MNFYTVFGFFSIFNTYVTNLSIHKLPLIAEFKKIQNYEYMQKSELELELNILNFTSLFASVEEMNEFDNH